MILVTGGSGSGKSAYAEKIILDSGLENRYYLATMHAGDEEVRDKIAAHRRRREGQNWITIEEPCDLSRAAEQIGTTDSALLLEDLPNLLANVMFGTSGTVADITAGLQELEKKVSFLVIVTGSVFDDGITYDPETEKYLQILAQLNCRISACAEEVTESVVGIPVRIKGTKKNAN